MIPNSNIFLTTLFGSSPYNINVLSSIWGDGYKTGTEACDDKNTSSGDGCSSACNIESGWSWSGGSSTTKDICVEICGDGIRFHDNSTYCDDGNLINGDGWSSSWEVEYGFKCDGKILTSKSIEVFQ